jgi:hypothetical protein
LLLLFLFHVTCSAHFDYKYVVRHVQGEAKDIVERQPCMNPHTPLNALAAAAAAAKSTCISPPLTHTLLLLLLLLHV